MTEEIASRYRLERELGRGGMGTVYAAFDRTLERPVALKLLNEGALGTEGQGRLLREAKAAARLNHANVVTVHDAGVFEGSPYIVMELVEGTTLHQARPSDLVEIARIGLQLASALEHAHAHGVIHRDLKPENVLLGPDGAARLMDFGLARSVASRLTEEGTIVGSVFYLAPEQAMGKAVDGRADLYSLGVMLYELVTGRLPFTADEALAVISQHLHASPVRPSSYREQLQPEFEAVILKLMAKDPADRFASAADLRVALEGLAPGDGATSHEGASHEAVAPTLDDLARGRLVGRETELNELLGLWELAKGGRGQLALISGEPGVGKTRLAKELIFRAQMRGGLILSGGCYEFEANTPYMPFVEALRGWVRESDPESLRRYLDSTAPIVARLAPELESKLGTFEPLPDLSSNEERLRLFDGIARLLRRLASERSVLLFLDDVHWADQGTLNLMHYLLRHLREDSVLMLGCYREVELDRSHPLADSLVAWNKEHLVTRIPLGRFSTDETRQLLDTLFQEGGSEVFVNAIHHETEGNPFFIEEVIKALVEGGEVYRAGSRWERKAIEQLAIPQSVKEAIGRRLNRLTDTCTEVLHVAAVLGKTFSFDDLEAIVVDEDKVLDAIDEARKAQLLESAGGEDFAFTHDKIREVLYQEQNPIRRRRLHSQIGEMIENRYAQEIDSKVQDLAHHFAEAGELERGFEYSMRAARDALSFYSPNQAISLAENALDCALALQDPVRERDAYHLQAQTYSASGRFPPAVAAISEAIARTDDSLLKANLKVELGTYYTLLSDPKGQAVLQEAVEVLEQQKESASLANAITLLGRYHHYHAEHRQAIEHCQRALAIAEQLQDTVATLNAYAYLAGAHQHLVETPISEAYAHKCIQLGEVRDFPFSVAVGHEFLAENAFFTGHWENGLHHAQEDQRIGEELGSLDRVSWGLLAQSACLLGLGRLEHALTKAREAMGLAEDLEELRLAVWVGGFMTSILADLGRLDEARESGEIALERAESLAQIALRTFARSALAGVWIYDDTEVGLQLLNEAHDIVRGTENSISYTWIYPNQTRLLVASGKIEELGDLVPHIFELAQKGESRLFQGLGHKYQAICDWHRGDTNSARKSFEQAIEHLDQSQTLPELARTHRQRGECLKREGDLQAAEADLAAAVELFGECGMPIEKQEAEALLLGTATG